MIAATQRLPEVIWKSLTWDQGTELRNHAEIKIATGLDIYFCDPGKPWQRGSNENTNGLLRQYFPKGTDFSVYQPDELELVGRSNEPTTPPDARLAPSCSSPRSLTLDDVGTSRCCADRLNPPRGRGGVR
jgi:hypothetical protein